MGVEPTLDQEAGRATVLKTARPTGTRPPPGKCRTVCASLCSRVGEFDAQLVEPLHVIRVLARRPAGDLWLLEPGRRTIRAYDA